MAVTTGGGGGTAKKTTKKYDPFTLGGKVPRSNGVTTGSVKLSKPSAKTGSGGAGAGDARGSGKANAAGKTPGQSKAATPKSTTTTSSTSTPVDYSSVYDSITPAAAAAASKSLAQYIAEANKDLGKGTDYSALKKQYTKDNTRADTNIKNMYAALGAGIRSDDASYKSIFEDAAKQQKAAGAQATSTINGAYAAGKANAQAATQATGASVGLAAQFAAADQGNSVARAAAEQQGALTDTSGRESNARLANIQAAQSSDFRGANERADLEQGYEDNLAKLAVQQSTEDATRRQQATSLALQMQGNDQTQANNLFSQQMQLASAKEQEQAAAASASAKQLEDQNAQALALYKLGLDPTTGKPLKSVTAAAAAKAKLDRANLLIKALSATNGNTTAAQQALAAAGY